MKMVLGPGLVNEEEFDIRKEAAYALCNACSGGSPQTISGLVYHGVVACFCSLLSAPDAELIFAVLEALGAALDAGEAGANGGANRVVQLVEEVCGHGLPKWAARRSHGLAHTPCRCDERGATVICLRVVWQAGGCEQLEALQMHENAEIYAKARPPP